MQRRVYILKAKLFDDPRYIYKVGVASGEKSIDRALQILRSHFMKYRYFPMMSIKRDRPCENAFEIETGLHQKFKDFKYYHEKKIDGANEWFDIPEDKLLQAYDDLLPLKGRK